MAVRGLAAGGRRESHLHCGRCCLEVHAGIQTESGRDVLRRTLLLPLSGASPEEMTLGSTASHGHVRARALRAGPRVHRGTRVTEQQHLQPLSIAVSTIHRALALSPGKTWVSSSESLVCPSVMPPRAMQGQCWVGGIRTGRDSCQGGQGPGDETGFTRPGLGLGPASCSTSEGTSRALMCVDQLTLIGLIIVLHFGLGSPNCLGHLLATVLCHLSSARATQHFRARAAPWSSHSDPAALALLRQPGLLLLLQGASQDPPPPRPPCCLPAGPAQWASHGTHSLFYLPPIVSPPRSPNAVDPRSPEKG